MIDGAVKVEVKVEARAGNSSSENLMPMACTGFTEMPVCQKANEVVKQVYQLCGKLPGSEEFAYPHK